MKSLLALVGPVFSLLAWFLLPRAIAKRAKAQTQSIDIESELPSEKIEKRLEVTHQHYLETMRDYDKGLLWASGGGFVVTYAIYEKILTAPKQDTWLLGFGWLLLVVTVLIRLAMPYSGTRIFVETKLYLKSLRRAAEEDEDSDAAIEQARLSRAKSEQYGKLTKLLNEAAFFSLVNAFYFLVAFFLLNLF